jgi:hypothetical protein
MTYSLYIFSFQNNNIDKIYKIIDLNLSKDIKINIIYDLYSICLKILSSKYLPNMYAFSPELEKIINEYSLDYSILTPELIQYIKKYCENKFNIIINLNQFRDEYFNNFSGERIYIQFIDYQIIKILNIFIEANYEKLNVIINEINNNIIKASSIDIFLKMIIDDVLIPIKIKNIVINILYDLRFYINNEEVNFQSTCLNYKNKYNFIIYISNICIENKEYSEFYFIKHAHEILHGIYFYYDISDYIINKSELINNLQEKLNLALTKLNFVRPEYIDKIDLNSKLKILIDEGFQNIYNKKSDFYISKNFTLDMYKFNEFYAYLYSFTITRKILAKIDEDIYYYIDLISSLNKNENLRLDKFIEFLENQVNNFDISIFKRSNFNFKEYVFDLFNGYLNSFLDY